MGLNIVKANDFSHSKNVIGMIYGATGTGKSTFAATGNKTLVLLSEPNGAASINAKNPDTDIISCDDMRELYKILVEVNKDNQWDNIVLDSLTDMQEKYRKKLENEYKEKGEKITWDFWKEIREATLSTVETFRNLNDCNKWIICREKTKEEKNEINEVVKSTTIFDLTGSNIHSDISAKCNLVGYTVRTEDGIYGLRFNNEKSFPLKKHPALLSEKYANPSIQVLLDEINGVTTETKGE